MWKSAEGHQVENLDNHLAAVVRAKEDLARINEDIQIALQQKDALISDNAALLKEKLAALMAKEDLIDKAQKILNEEKADHYEAINHFHEEHKKFDKSMEDLAVQKTAYLDLASNMAKEMDAREKACAERENTIALAEIALAQKQSAHAEYADQILNEKRKSEDNLRDAILSDQLAKDATAEANAKLSQAEKLNEETAAMKQDINAQTIIIKQATDVAIAARQKSQEDLDSVLKEKEDLKDLIIESKKVKSESLKSIETAQRLTIEANQKIAELNELKTAMAQQEK